MYEGRHIACCTAISNSFDGDHDHDDHEDYDHDHEDYDHDHDDDGENPNQIVGERGFCGNFGGNKGARGNVNTFCETEEAILPNSRMEDLFQFVPGGLPFEPFKLTGSKGKPTRGKIYVHGTWLRSELSPTIFFYQPNLIFWIVIH